MSDQDAFGDGMGIPRQLSTEDSEVIIAGRDPADGELAELAAFTRALRTAYTSATPPGDQADFVARLADAARAGAPADPYSENGLGSSPRSARPRRRLALAARVAVAVAAVPLLFAGLAFAGVGLPGPAQSVFEGLGIELPNQTARDDDDTEGTAHDGDSAGSATGQENSAGKLGHGKSKTNPARAGDRGHGAQGQGRALGKRGLAPGNGTAPGSSTQGTGQGGGSGDNPGGGGGDPGGSQGHSGSAGAKGGGPAGGGQGRSK